MRWLDVIENDLRKAGMCMKELYGRSARNLGREWLTPNSWEEINKDKENANH